MNDPCVWLGNLHYLGKYVWTIMCACMCERMHRQISYIRRAKSEKLNVFRIMLQLSLSNPSKPGVKLRMKM